MPYTPSWQDAAWRPPPTPAPPAAAGAPAAGAAPPAGAPNQPPGIIGNNPGPAGSNPMQGFANWMFAGGVNPNAWQNTGGVNASDWQNLGGGANLGFIDQFNQLLGAGANPTQVAPTTAASMQDATQPYTDAAYQQATRELDPQWASQEAQFNQQMVNQGLAPGSAAYQQAYTNFQNAKNDAYAQARNQAMQQGLAAQGQGFGQGLAQSQLASSLANALLGSQTGIANQQLGGNASITNQLLGGNQALMNALLSGNSNIAQQIIGGHATLGASANAAGASMHNADLSHDIGQQTLDNNMLMSLIGLGQGVGQYNNNLLTQDQQRNMNFFPYFPSGGGGSPIDVTGPYSQQYGGQMNQWNYANQQANAQNQMYGDMASAAMMMALMCSHDYKTTEGPLTPKKALQAIESLPVDMWRYRNTDQVHVGTYAEEFHKALDLPPSKTISVIDAFGAVMGAIQELSATQKRIMDRLDRLEAA